jgi:putative ABC transport system permease protein
MAIDNRESSINRQSAHSLIENVPTPSQIFRLKPGMTSALLDLRHSVRSLLRQPGILLTSLASLALGIGATSAIFSVAYAVLLRPLPYPEPDRLVTVWETMPGNDTRPVAPGNYLDWRIEARSFEALAAYFGFEVNVSGAGQTDRVPGMTVTGNFFPMLGVGAVAGRVFGTADDEGSDRLVVLSTGFWQRRFGADPAAVGRTIRLDDVAYTIVGVAADFRFHERAELWRLADRGVPVMGGLPPEVARGRDIHLIEVIGRLKPDVSIDQARGEMQTIASRLAAAHPNTNTGLGVNIVPLHVTVIGDTRPAILMLVGAVGLLLLIACANVASLLLARSAIRRRELAVRVALGADRARLVRQLLIESVALAIAGAIPGLVVARLALSALLKLAPEDLPRAAEIGIDPVVLTFAALASIGTGLLFGLAPALSASAPPAAALHEASRGAAGGRRGTRLRRALVVSELTLAQVLLGAAGLLIASFVRLAATDAGFAPEGLLTMQLSLTAEKYGDPARREQFYDAVIQELARLPQVTSAGSVMVLPIEGSRNRGFWIAGRPDPPPGQNQSVDFQIVSETYFRTLGVPIVRGRGFTPADARSSAPAVVINLAMATRYWPGEDPIGRQIRFGGPTPMPRTIVGIVGDVRHRGLHRATDPQAFISYRQDFEPFWKSAALAVRTSGDPAAIAAAARAGVARVDPNQAVGGVRTMDEIVARSVAPRRFTMTLATALAAIAATLAAVGTYGMLAWLVAARRREIGIRMALGAAPRSILRMIVSQALGLAALSALLGLAGALALGRAMRTLLFATAPSDPTTLAVVTAGLGLLALMASAVPALRAARVDPALTMRDE